YEAWIKRFTQQHPEVALVYDAVGSGEGQRRFLAQSVDFGASDAALSDEQIASARSGATLVPVTAGMVVLAYNLPDLGGRLQLPRDVYVDMFAGPIRVWNDPRIAAANPGLALPAPRRAGGQRTAVRPDKSSERARRDVARPRPRRRQPRRRAGRRDARPRHRRRRGAHQGEQRRRRVRRVPLCQAPRPADGAPP